MRMPALWSIGLLLTATLAVRAAPAEWEMRTSDAELLCERGEHAKALMSAEQ